MPIDSIDTKRVKGIERGESVRSYPRTAEGLELEREQLGLVQSVSMCEHEQVLEFVLFMTEMRRYLTGLSKPKFNPQVIKWLKLLSRYTKVFGLPKAAHGYIRMACANRDARVLEYGLGLACEFYRSRMQELRVEKECEDE